jgi:hypothetical protein
MVALPRKPKAPRHIQAISSIPFDVVAVTAGFGFGAGPSNIQWTPVQNSPLPQIRGYVYTGIIQRPFGGGINSGVGVYGGYQSPPQGFRLFGGAINIGPR